MRYAGAMRLVGMALLLSASVSHAYGAIFPQNSSSSTTTQSSNNSTQSTGQSTASTSNSSGSSGVAAPTMSTIVLASALLLGTAGGLITTFYSNAVAQKRAEEFRKLHPTRAEPPRPVEPEPLNLPPPPSEPTAPPPPPQVKVEPPIDAMVMARSWLLANELQLEQDLALGAGPAIDDLAGIAAIAPSNRARFGKLLQRNRSLLLARRDVTPRQAAAMMARVGDLVMADPILRADGELALAR